MSGDPWHRVMNLCEKTYIYLYININQTIIENNYRIHCIHCIHRIQCSHCIHCIHRIHCIAILLTNLRTLQIPSGKFKTWNRYTEWFENWLRARNPWTDFEIARKGIHLVRNHFGQTSKTLNSFETSSTNNTYWTTCDTHRNRSINKYRLDCFRMLSAGDAMHHMVDHVAHHMVDHMWHRIVNPGLLHMLCHMA